MSTNRIEKFMMSRLRAPAWLVGMLIIAVIIGTVFFGALVEHAATAREPGAMGRAAVKVARLPTEAYKLVKRIGKSDLRAPGDRFAGARGFERDPSASDGGLLLLPRYDRDRRRSVVEIVRLTDGAVLHAYAPDIAAINARSDLPRKWADLKRDKSPARYMITHPILEKDGSLIFHGMDSPLVKIDACSRIAWTIDGVFHHAIERDAEGHYWTAGLRLPPRLRGVREDFLDDSLIRFSSDGEILFRRAIGDILLENGQSGLVYGQARYQDDPFHINDIQPALADGPHWKRGDVFVSLRNRSLILLYRPSADKIVWMKHGPWMMQHDVDILDDHRIAIFNNNDAVTQFGERVFGHNETLIHDLETGRTLSPFRDAYQRYDIRTSSEGRSEFLDDGGILIEEQNHGRILKLGPDGEIDWRYVNRASDGHVYLVRWARYIPPEKAPKVMAALERADCAPAPK